MTTSTRCRSTAPSTGPGKESAARPAAVPCKSSRRFSIRATSAQLVLGRGEDEVEEAAKLPVDEAAVEDEGAGLALGVVRNLEIVAQRGPGISRELPIEQAGHGAVQHVLEAGGLHPLADGPGVGAACALPPPPGGRHGSDT